MSVGRGIQGHHLSHHHKAGWEKLGKAGKNHQATVEPLWFVMVGHPILVAEEPPPGFVG